MTGPRNKRRTRMRKVPKGRRQKRIEMRQKRTWWKDRMGQKDDEPSGQSWGWA